MSCRALVIVSLLVWPSLALARATELPPPNQVPGPRPVAKPAAKPYSHWATGGTTEQTFRTAKAAATFAAALQLDKVMRTPQKPAVVLRNLLGQGPVSSKRLKDTRISSHSPRAGVERHQVVTKATVDGQPIAKVRVSVLRLDDGSYKAYDDGAFRRVQVFIAGAYIAASDRIAPAPGVPKVKPVAKKPAPTVEPVPGVQP